MELLRREFSEITIVEKSSTQAAFLESRFQGRYEGVDVCLLSNLKALKQRCVRKPFSTVFIRGDFIREWSKKEIGDVLAILSAHLPESVELVIETWEIDPIIARIVATVRGTDFQNKVELPPTRSWWQATLERHFEGVSRLYQVEGPHWCARTYMPWSARDERGMHVASQSYLRPARYIDRLTALADPSGILIVHKRAKPLGVATIDDVVMMAEGDVDLERANGYRVSGGGTAMLWPIERGPILRMPLTPQARPRCKTAHEAFAELHQSLPLQLKTVLPTSSYQEYSSTMAVYSEPLMPGAPGAQGLSLAKIDSALEWLAKFHVHTHSVVTNPTSEAGRVLQSRLRELVELGDFILEKHAARSQQAQWSKLKESLLNPPWESGIALCRTHGDFHIRNLLFAENDALSGVIDWETSATPTLPIRDLFWFELSRTTVGQHATAEVYERDLLTSKPPAELRAYYETVEAEIWRSLWHPWCRLVYPLERLKTIWDGFELAGLIEPNPFAEDWIRLIAPLGKFQEREGLLRKL